MNIIKREEPDEPPSRVSDIKGTRSEPKLSGDTIKFLIRLAYRRRQVGFRIISAGFIPSSG